MEILERYETGVIALIDIDKLHDHEKIKQSRLDELTKAIKEDKVLKKPIIVDKYSDIVLDGHHRYFACKALGCKRISAYVVDYYSPEIKVEAWHPVVKTKNDVKAIFKTLANHDFIISEVQSEAAVKVLVDSKQACAGMIVENHAETYFIIQNSDKTFKDVMECIQTGLATEGRRKELDYVGEESEAENMLRQKKASMVIVIPTVTKERVIEMGLSPETFPPKTTRHIIPGKVDYPVPLSKLMKAGKSSTGS
jgi:uncharacterized protein (DUF1015 family)